MMGSRAALVPRGLGGEQPFMEPITGYRAIWHPGQNRYAIMIRTEKALDTRVAIDSPQEFVAVLAVLNGPEPALAADGSITCSRDS